MKFSVVQVSAWKISWSDKEVKYCGLIIWSDLQSSAHFANSLRSRLKDKQQRWQLRPVFQGHLVGFIFTKLGGLALSETRQHKMDSCYNGEPANLQREDSYIPYLHRVGCCIKNQ